MANLVAAIGTASANSGFVAARPTGLILVPQSRGAIMKRRGDSLTPWQPNVLDVCADDWQAGPLATVLAALEAGNAG